MHSIVLALMCVGFAAIELRADEPLHVEQLEKAAFRRVAGAAAQGAALDVGPAGSWYRSTVGMPAIDFDGTTWRLWFVGDEPTSDPQFPYGIIERIGLATSTDGLQWKVANDGKPVLDLGPAGSADAKGLAHPYVLRVEGRYWMWYGGIDGRTARDIGQEPSNVRLERICLATSADGVKWERANGGKPVLDIGPKGSIDGIQATGMHILKVGDRFMMGYGAYGSRKHTVAVATSPDGISWERLHDGEPITGLVGGAQGQLGASVHFDGRRFFMLYGGDKGGAWDLYAAVSDDGYHFRRLNDERPVLATAPKGNFDTAGVGRNFACHPTRFVATGNKLRIWYMGEDGSPPHFQRIGLMEAVLP